MINSYKLFLIFFSLACKFQLQVRCQNPIITNIFTADPCAVVYNNTVYLYTGHDEASTSATDYLMNNWHVFSSQDMKKWSDHGQKLSLSDFKWASAAAFAGHVVARNDKFYWYVPMLHKPALNYGPYFGIGVAVADSPLGPFKDALGKPLISDNLTADLQFDIDPAVFIDDDEQAYIYWGNATSNGPLKMAKLKSNMTEIDGKVSTVSIPNFTEAPYVHKRNNTYYLSYASGWPETISYATSSSPLGPWTFKGTLNGLVSSATNHQSIIEFHDQWYFVYHNADLPTGGDYRRSVCIDYLNYNNDGSIKKIIQTKTGVSAVDLTGVDENDENAKVSLAEDWLCNFTDGAKAEYELLNFQGQSIAHGFGEKWLIQSLVQQSAHGILLLNSGGKNYRFKFANIHTLH